MPHFDSRGFVFVLAPQLSSAAWGGYASCVYRGVQSSSLLSKPLLHCGDILEERHCTAVLPIDQSYVARSVKLAQLPHGIRESTAYIIRTYRMDLSIENVQNLVAELF